MDDSYIESSPPYMGRGVKVLLLLTLLRIKNPVRWAAFLTLNPAIRSWLQTLLKASQKDQWTVDRRVRKLSNLISVSFLYSATSGNLRIPKDYISLYLIEAYYGKLVPPSSPVVVSPTTAKYFRVSAYPENGWVQKLYRNKQYLVFPILCGQVLSNYLAPTQYKLNQKYFSAFIKKRFLDPIWINFRLGVRAHSVNWLGLIASYSKHNALLFMYLALTNFRTRLLAKYYQISSGHGGDIASATKTFIFYCLNRANTVANFVYLPNLLSMLVIALTAPMLTRFGPLKRMFMKNQKQTVKTYMKVVGFTAGLSAMLLQTMDLPSTKKHVVSEDSEAKSDYRLDPGFYNAVGVYLTHLIVLSKWRILKENHPWFTLLKVGTWQRMETAVMCLLVWKLMNLNDYLSRNILGSGDRNIETLKGNTYIKAIDWIMN